MGSKMASASRVVQVKPGPLPRLEGRKGWCRHSGSTGRKGGARECFAAAALKEGQRVCVSENGTSGLPVAESK